MNPIGVLYFIHFIFSMVISFSNLFMNVFFWHLQQDFLTIGVFNLFSVTFIFISTLTGAWFLRISGSRSTFVLSALLAFFQFFFLLVFKHFHLDFLPFLGILYGSYIGLFFISFNLYLLWFSNEKNRSFLVGLEYVISGLAQLLTPIASGMFIMIKGYQVTFFIILILLSAQVIASFFSPNLQVRSKFSKRNLFMPKDEKLLNIGFVSAAYGFFFSFIQLSFGIFIYLFLQNEFSLGSWNMFFSFLTIVTYWVVGKVLNQSNRDWLARMGMILAVVITLTLLIPSAPLFVLFNLVISVALPLLWLPVTTLHFKNMIYFSQQTKEIGMTRLMETLVFREFAIALGRIAFFLFIVIGFDVGMGFSYYLMVVLIIFLPVGMYFLHHQLEENG
ncbi:MFS transporter [Microaerobacter geothermalis]|uniref:MFS transporter n=1 Tax=Microaerobacter geothermalis TaxID=674972 RepID=UPI001F3C193E|nr:MFS transporter [Microaerobacter geothermalis]MCF6094868.1 MFS transporter [Microaerobacter geothermalis]